MSQKIYEAITKKNIEIIKQAIEDVIEGKKTLLPWQKGWVGGTPPQNILTKTVYRGSNVFNLNNAAVHLRYPTNYWISGGFKKKGARIKKEEYRKNQWVIHFHKKTWEDEDTGQVRSIPRMKAWQVWNIEQIEDFGDIVIPEEPEAHDFTPHEESMVIIQRYLDAERSSTKLRDLEIEYRDGTPSYYPGTHHIQIPPKTRFTKEWDFPFTIFHELIHSTGHEDILNRGLERNLKGGSKYSMEELVAETGAMFLANIVGLEIEFDNSIEYLRGWLSRLELDSRLIVQAGSRAQKAVDHILGIEFKYEDNGDQT